MPRPPSHAAWHPLLHLLNVLAVVFFILYIAFEISCPHCHSHPPADPSLKYPHLPLVPPSSVCQSFDRLPFIFIFNPKSLTLSQTPYTPQNIFLAHLLPSTFSRRRRNQPWPRPKLQPTLKLATFNIRSASSITDLYNKPEILKHLIHDKKIDILCLTETWLHPDTLPAIINSLLPPSFNISHCPRPQGGGGGTGFIFNNKISAQNVTLPKYSSFEIQCLSFTARPPTNIRSCFHSH